MFCRYLQPLDDHRKQYFNRARRNLDELYSFTFTVVFTRISEAGGGQADHRFMRFGQPRNSFAQTLESSE